MKRARAEVREKIPDGPLDLEQLNKLTFLDQVSREVLRSNRLNASTLTARIKEPIHYLGYSVPKDWRAYGGIFTTMQDENVFTRPDEFDPDRFGPDRTEDTKQENSYIPQGGGPREGHRCPGEPHVNWVMKLVAVRLLKNYTWELPPQNLALNSAVFPIPKDNLKVRFYKTADKPVMAKDKV